MTRRGVLLYVAGLVAALLLPIAASRLRPLPPGRCERDGVAVTAPPAASFVDAAGRTHDFCSIRCAGWWIDRVRSEHVRTDAATDRPVRVLVRDETTGATIDARSAWFVRSFAAAGTGDRTHAFATREGAESHAATFDGDLLEGDRRPFREPNAERERP